MSGIAITVVTTGMATDTTAGIVDPLWS
jgi:hypothetical protein